MSNWWKYVVGGLAGSFLAGNVGLLGGLYVGSKRVYQKGISESYVIRDINSDGDPDLCVMKSENELTCSSDFNNDGAMDILTYNAKEDKVTDIKFGKNVCKNSQLEELLYK